MDDLEMTKLCARAMGLPELNDDFDYEDEEGSIRSYTPLVDDAQAMALVKKFNIHIEAPDLPVFVRWGVFCWIGPDKGANAHGRSTDLNRAIVECVAKMQSTKSAQSTDKAKASA